MKRILTTAADRIRSSALGRHASRSARRTARARHAMARRRRHSPSRKKSCTAPSSTASSVVVVADSASTCRATHRRSVVALRGNQPPDRAADALRDWCMNTIPTADKWTKKKVTFRSTCITRRRRPINGKLYIFGGCLRAITGEGATANTWEYDPVADSHTGARAAAGQALLGAGGDGQRQDLRDRRPRDVREWPGQPRVGPERDARPGDQHVDGTQPDADVAEPRVLRRGQREDLRDRRTHRGAANIGLVTNIDVVEEYDPATNLWGVVKQRMPTRAAAGSGDVQRQDLRVGRRDHELPAVGGLQGARSVRSRQRHVGHSAVDAERAPRRRRGLHRQQAAPREREAGRRRRAGHGGH